MPYISPEARERYKELIEESVHAIMDGNEAKFVKGEYFGFLVNRIVRGYMGSSDKNTPAFNSSLFNIPKQKKLLELTDKYLIYLNQDEPLESAGELNYVISAVLWGIQGSMEGIEQGNYGWRCYLRGVMENIRNMMSTSTFTTTGEQKDRLKAGRRYVVALGVVNDVISECYRTQTTAYENDKRGTNGDIWAIGKLVEGA